MNKNRGRENRIWKLFSLPPFLLYLLSKLYKQKRFIDRELLPQIYPFEQGNDGSISPADLKKITSYYALGVPVVLGEAFAILRGTALSKDERYSITFLGGISGLLDDLFDDPLKDASNLIDFIEHPESLIPKNSYEALLLHLYQAGLAKSKHRECLKAQARNVFDSQLGSLEQQSENSSASHLKSITFEKGGSSFLFYRMCLDSPLGNAEEKLIYHLGGLMQLGNDIFDLYEDIQLNIHTVATCSTEIKDLRILFSEELEHTSLLAKGTNYPKKQTDLFIDLIKFVLSRVFVCLDQFEKLQLETGGKFEPKNYARKPLICDMQKATNQIKALRYYVSL